MREILTISIDSKLKEKIEKSSKKFNVSKSELIKKAVEKYIAIQDFREIREQLLSYGEKSGILTDDDVFNEIS